jgi:hypothetical protein
MGPVSNQSQFEQVRMTAKIIRRRVFPPDITKDQQVRNLLRE